MEVSNKFDGVGSQLVALGIQHGLLEDPLEWSYWWEHRWSKLVIFQQAMLDCQRLLVAISPFWLVLSILSYQLRSSIRLNYDWLDFHYLWLSVFSQDLQNRVGSPIFCTQRHYLTWKRLGTFDHHLLRRLKSILTITSSVKHRPAGVHILKARA